VKFWGDPSTPPRGVEVFVVIYVLVVTVTHLGDPGPWPWLRWLWLAGGVATAAQLGVWVVRWVRRRRAARDASSTVRSR
jgi:bacteriorhodopsin